MWSCPPRKGTEAARYDQGGNRHKTAETEKAPHPDLGNLGQLKVYIRRAFGRRSEKVAPEITGTGEGHCLVSNGNGQSSRWRPWLV